MSDLTWTTETRRVSDLIPWPRNPRQIRKEQAARLSDSLDRFGQVETIAIGPGNEVYNGHQRLNVWAQEHGPDFEVAVRVSSRPLTEKEREKLVVFLHRGAAGEWDFDTLANEFELGELLEWGFEERDLELDLWAKEPPADPGPQIDRAEELQEKWRVQRGQVWQIGRHRLMCGDSTSAEDVGRLMGESVPLLTITDPPYGVDYDPVWRQKAAEAGLLAYATRRIGQVTNDGRIDWSDAWQFAPGAVMHCWHAGRHASSVQASLELARFEIRCQIIWSKPHFPISRGHYHWRHEPCWYAVRKHGAAHWIGDRKQTTVWEISLDKNVEGGHSTQKPVECFARPLRNHEGDVYDPFLGSGTCLVAAEQVGRIGYGMEIEPKYCAVTLERLTGMGLEARLVE